MAVNSLPVFDRMYTRLSLPVLMKEMRVRMRGIRAPILLFVTTAITIVIGLIIICTSGWDSMSYGPGNSQMAEVGRNLFTGITILEGILCALIAPALTAGAVSIEREQQTLDLLLLTRLSNLNILLGKLVSALSFVAMILICALPVVAISFLLGGVDPAQLCWAATVVFATACLFSTIGLFSSTRYAKTSTAVAVAYVACLAWLAAIPLLGSMMGLFADSANTQAFYVFVTGAALIAALIPMMIAGALFIVIARRPVPWLANLVFWLLFSAAGVYYLSTSFPALIKAIKPSFEYILLGNPITAIVYITSGASWSNMSTPWLTNNFVPVTVGYILFSMLVVLVLTIGQFMRLRNQ